MLILSEEDVRALASPADAFTAVEGVYRAVALKEAVNYPVVREACGKAVFGVKSGFDATKPALGLKAGGYWPDNAARGLTNHQSAAVLFDAETGRAGALLSGNYITALRTAAACAVSIAHLARKDVETLAVIGAGAQVPHHVLAALQVRPFQRVRIWNRTEKNAQTAANALRETWSDVEVAPDVNALCAEADVIVTLTPSTRPVLQREFVQPGTHVAAMGSDTAGKQELDENLVGGARVFVDDLEQSKTIGERQYLRKNTAAADPALGLLGEVLLGRIEGRESDQDITVFDSTGIALQDIALAALIVERARRENIGVEIDF